eukprot:TRINITY_DN6463_c0_g1_i2.p1 TRINITY_DN6463_c0_g1~~TRINITY_DN6463_c0_g1_i2.p1  ORF type:complete len:392 (-),score=67.45 TRINITY_DN6463_c0_g1_i2:157-1332(-)
MSILKRPSTRQADLAPIELSQNKYRQIQSRGGERVIGRSLERPGQLLEDLQIDRTQFQVQSGSETHRPFGESRNQITASLLITDRQERINEDILNTERDKRIITENMSKSVGLDGSSLMKSIRTRRYNEANIDTLEGTEKQRFDVEMCGFVKGRCICGRCKWPHDLGPKLAYRNFKTLYNQDFALRPPGEQSRPVDATVYETKPLNEKLEISSTMRADYKPQPMVNTESLKPNQKTTFQLPLAATTAYRSAFIGYGKNIPHIEPLPEKRTVISELPFLKRTTYRDTYLKKTPRPDQKSAERPPDNGILLNAVPFLGESVYRSGFRPFRMKPESNVKPKEESELLTPAYDGQFTSETGKAFIRHGVQKCPAREVIEDLAKTSVQAQSVLNNL